MSKRALQLLGVGALVAGVGYTFKDKFTSRPPVNCSKPVSAIFKDSGTFYDFKLLDKENVTHDVRRIRFEIPDKLQAAGLAPGQHVVVKAVVDGQTKFRPYSPTTSNDDKGYFDLVLKVYKLNSQFPSGGVMSQHLDSLPVGSLVTFKGPIGRLKYLGNGVLNMVFVVDKQKDETKVVEKKYKNIGMVAGGTGLTPLYQIVKNVCKNQSDETKVSMVFSNHTENDILLRKELDDLARKNKDKFNMWYTITKSVEKGWPYSIGRVTESMFKKNLPAPGDDTVILICGPPGFVKASSELLQKMGHAKEAIFEY